MPDQTPTTVVVPESAVPAPAETSTTTYIKWGAAFTLGAAVLALDVMKVPADHFINLVVVPGFACLGMHTAAKTLN